MSLCDAAGPFDFENSCIRATWTSLLPAAFVFVLCIFALPLPRVLQNVTIFGATFQPFLTLEEAEAMNASVDGAVAPLWRTAVLVFVGLAETLVWLTYGSYNLTNDFGTPWVKTLPFFLAFPWLYTVVRPVVRPIVTAPLDLIAYDYAVFDVPSPSTVNILALLLNFFAILELFIIILSIPFAIPSEQASEQLDASADTATPEDYITLCEWITFSWVYPLIKKGRSTTLQEDDVWNLSPTVQSRPVFLRFCEIRRSTLLRKLWAVNSLDVIMDFVLTVLTVFLNYTKPFFLKLILDTLDTSKPNRETRSKAYIYAFLSFACSIARSQCELQHLWFGRRAATRIRSELMSAIYDKALKRKDYSGVVDKRKQKEEQDNKAWQSLSKKERKARKKEKKKAEKAEDVKAGADIGKIVNLMAGDANKVSNTLAAMYMIYGAPFEIIIAGVYLYQLLGLSAFAGLIVLVAAWPLNSIAAGIGIKIQKFVLAARDRRMAVLSELFSSVKFIKFFAWEDKWIKRVLDARQVEIRWMTKARINSVLFYLLWTSVPVLVSILSFFAFVAQGNELTVSVAFTAIALFNMVRAPLNVIPTWIVQILQTGIALKRISVYLDEDEVSEQVSSLKDKSPSSSDPSDEDGFGFENASFNWNEVLDGQDTKANIGGTVGSPALSPTVDGSISITIEEGSPVDSLASGPEQHEQHFELRDIDVKFPEGRLTLITGPTASGKTALLMALLGEMTTINGRIIMSKNPSRVDEHGLMHVISYAAQTPWLRHQSIRENILFDSPYEEERYNQVVECCALKPDLDILEDGDSTEIGVRVALARAVYARTKYVLLDDPLSAVDSHTARHLFEKLLCGPLLADRTVILVTHHVDLVLPGAYYLVRILDGRIDTQGTIADLRAQDAKEIVAAIDNNEIDVIDDGKKSDNADKKPRKLVKDEHRELGGVKWSIYNSYLKASSYYIWGFLAFLVIANQLLGVTEKVWIKIWGEAHSDVRTSAWLSLKSFATPEHEIPLDGHVTYHYQMNHEAWLYRVSGTFGINWPDAIKHPMFYVGIYAAIGLAGALVSVLSVTAQYTGALRASRILFKQLLVTVVRATFRFHDTTPQGRMLNRFGKDMETIDMSLAGSLQAVNSSLASFFTAILTVAVIFPYFLLPALFFGFAYRELAIGYLNTGRDLRRMESNTRSPIFSYFSELLEGIVTVRAFSAERRFLDNLHRKIDTTTKMWYTFWMTNRWLLLNFDMLGSLSILITTLFSIATLIDEAGLAGLCITSAMGFTSSVYWACRFWTALELDLNSVERVVEYLDLPQEPPVVIESNRVPAYWPSLSNHDALISVENLTVKYAPDLPAVLHDVSFTLKGGERVGLLGRTGSGKSTLAMSLLRFVDPASGRIVIDGIDISKIGLHDLRSRIDAALFSGTLRDNLDPFGIECLDVLRRVQMIGTNTRVGIDSKTTVTLDTQVSPGGMNFSQGQRQLVAMARALLRRTTSSIDFATDAKIQATIREEFTESLLVTVAHRLRTVIDYDRLIVLDKGQIAEFDTPWNLLQKGDGIFRNMCLKSGSLAELEALARAKAENASSVP
ncbi:multidrug resistance-associated ABC transporter [Amanita rubescens]|nr:multidrug resistance-associated ABC transporter [Amanita rubescens]